MFYGPGAGMLPTASAVVGDIVEIARHLDETIPVEWEASELATADYRELSCAYFVRTADSEEAVKAAFPHASVVKVQDDELGFVTEEMDGYAYEEAIQKLDSVIGMIRVKG